MPDIEQTAELIREISVAVGEQRSGAELISGAIARLDEVIRHNVTSSKQMTSAASNLTGEAENLQTALNRVQLDDKEEESKDRELLATR